MSNPTADDTGANTEFDMSSMQRNLMSQGEDTSGVMHLTSAGVSQAEETTTHFPVVGNSAGKDRNGNLNAGYQTASGNYPLKNQT
jgi:hypothetical protein